MRIPAKRASKGMEDTDKPWDKVFRFVQGMEQFFDDVRNSLKEAVEQVAVFQKKVAKGFINGKDKMSVSTTNQFKGHGSSSVVGIFRTTGRTKLRMTTKRNKLEGSTMGAAIHGTAIRRITAVDHLIDIFHFRISGMKSIFNFFIMVRKDFL